MGILGIIGGPQNYCSTAEAGMHDSVAGKIKDLSVKHPKAAKLGAIPICLITLTTRPVFNLASFIEAATRCSFNLIGAIFSKTCRENLAISAKTFLHYTFILAFSPLTTLFIAGINTVLSASSPSLYKSYTEISLNISRTSDPAEREQAFIKLKKLFSLSK